MRYSHKITIKYKSGTVLVVNSKTEACKTLKIGMKLLNEYLSKEKEVHGKYEAITEKKTPIVNMTLLKKTSALGRSEHNMKMKRKRDTVFGKVQEMWGNLKFRPIHNKYYKGVKVNMSQEEFYEWAFPYVKKAMKEGMRHPTVDRVDVSIGYQIGNLEIISKSDNSKKQFSDKPEIREALKDSAKERFSKKVRVMLLDGSSKVYNSAKEVDLDYNNYTGYTSYRISGERPLPPSWKNIKYLE